MNDQLRISTTLLYKKQINDNAVKNNKNLKNKNKVKNKIKTKKDKTTGVNEKGKINLHSVGFFYSDLLFDF